VLRPGGLFPFSSGWTRPAGCCNESSQTREITLTHGVHPDEERWGVPPPDLAKCDSEQTGTQQHKAGRC
jgi:hypothetical protein